MADKKTKTEARPNKKTASGKTQEKGGRDVLPLKTRRSIAKTGMVASLATLTITGAAEALGGQTPKSSKTLHVWSGFALVGFSLWHYMLYKPADGKNN